MKIEQITSLREKYGTPSYRAKNKQLNALEKHTIHFIEKSPFFVISTFGKDQTVDTSPRGGAPGFVKVLDNKTILVPDAKGNNRVDSFANIIETGRIGTLFLIPGIDETLRINGTAEITTDSKYLDLFPNETHPPKACVLIKIEEVFMHCAKALMRSKLWDASAQIERSDFPTMGQILKDQIGGIDVPESQEDMEKRYQKDL